MPEIRRTGEGTAGTMLPTRCHFYIRHQVSGGYHYASFDPGTPEPPFIPLSTAPQVNDLVWLYDRAAKAGSTYRVLERSWQYSEYGSINWPYGTPEPTVGPMVDIIVEPAEGLFQNEMPEAQQVISTEEMPQSAAFAVLSPDGTVTWHDVDAEKAVERTVAGAHPGALERRWLGPSCPLKVMASDVSALHPDDFAENALARQVIRALSRGHIEQQWRGPVAVYAHDEGYAEVMPREWVERITRLTIR